MTKDAKRISEQELDKVAGGELGWDIYDPLKVKRDKEPSSMLLSPRDKELQELIKDPPPSWGRRPHIPDGKLVSGDKEDLEKLFKGN